MGLGPRREWVAPFGGVRSGPQSFRFRFARVSSPLFPNWLCDGRRCRPRCWLCQLVLCPCDSRPAEPAPWLTLFADDEGVVLFQDHGVQGFPQGFVLFDRVLRSERNDIAMDGFLRRRQPSRILPHVLIPKVAGDDVAEEDGIGAMSVLKKALLERVEGIIGSEMDGFFERNHQAGHRLCQGRAVDDGFMQSISQESEDNRDEEQPERVVAHGHRDDCDAHHA